MPQKPGESSVDCPTCGGARYVYESFESSRVVPCPACNSPLIASGLTKHEQRRFADMKILPYDHDGVVDALLYAGRKMVSNGVAFATIYGTPGSAKTLFARVLVTELCAVGVRARYVTAATIEESFFNHGTFGVEDEGMGRTSIYAAAQALVIDELQAANWGNPWVHARMQELLSHRHSLADAPANKRLLTVMIAQTHPTLWGDEKADLRWLLSRMRDGRYAFAWEGDRQPPACLMKRTCVSCGKKMRRAGDMMVCECKSSRPIEVYWPFAVDLPDVRPVLPQFKDAE